MKNHILITCMLFLLAVLFYRCNKYENLNASGLSGRLEIRDTLAVPVTSTMNKVSIFFNAGSDTTTYLSKTLTDSMGNFFLPSTASKDAVLYANFLKDHIFYKGSVQLNTLAGAQRGVVLTVRPVYQNGFALSFGSSTGQLPNYPFRIYANRSAAIVDSARFAILNDKTSTTGSYRKYNILARRYYITAKDSISGAKTKLLDSIDVPVSGTVNRTVTVH
ncbi:hypothetical protein [Pedobacter sp. P26]|uniref:hypothetical protein n=1 Tax=Pedobacter sp. P26 TaxID=3423956 RepID=UPI003D668630